VQARRDPLDRDGAFLLQARRQSQLAKGLKSWEDASNFLTSALSAAPGKPARQKKKENIEFTNVCVILCSWRTSETKPYVL
jgi:hypothetical protein